MTFAPGAAVMGSEYVPLVPAPLRASAASIGAPPFNCTSTFVSLLLSVALPVTVMLVPSAIEAFGAGWVIDTAGEAVSALTSRTKLLVAVALPSLTVTVRVATPVFPGRGVTVMVRAPSAPPRTMLELGTSKMLSETALTMSEPAGVSTSPTVNGSAPVEVPGLMPGDGMPEMVGVLFNALPVMVMSNEAVTGSLLVM